MVIWFVLKFFFFQTFANEFKSQNWRCLHGTIVEKDTTFRSFENRPALTQRLLSSWLVQGWGEQMVLIHLVVV